MDRIEKKYLPILLTVQLLILFPVFSYSQGIIINSGASVKNTGKLILKGDWINNGTFSDLTGMVVFSGSAQSLSGTSACTFNNLTISSGSSATINASSQAVSGILLCNGSLNANGNLTLLSTASGTSLIDGSGTGTVTGNVTMQRYLPSGFGYKYFSSPFQAATVNEFGDDMNLAASFTSFYKYDENRNISGVPASGWVSYKTATNVLIPMAGYAVNFGSTSSPNTVDVTGVVNNGSMAETLYNHNNPYTKGFNLAGNPYPSPINWDAPTGWIKTNIDNALYFFKASATDQYGGTYSTYINGISSDGNATNIIPSMQGFFVHVSDGVYPVTATLGLDNRVRITDRVHPFLKSAKISTVVLLRLSAQYADNPALPDKAVLYFDENASKGFDCEYDALKLNNTDKSVPNLFSVTPDGEKLSINGLPGISDTAFYIPLGLKIYKTGDVILSLCDLDSTLSAMKIYISDMVTGARQELLPNNGYRVHLNAGEYLNRFFLNFNSSGVITRDNDYQVQKTDLFTTYCSHGSLITEVNCISGGGGTIMIYNLMGQGLFAKKVYETGYHEFNPNIKDGIYIVTYSTGLKRCSKKIFIQN